MSLLSPVQRKLVVNNFGLISYYKTIYHPEKYYTVPEEDTKSILAEGLCRAARKYNPESGYKFSTYALKAMHNWFSRCVRQYQNRLTISAHYFEKYIKDLYWKFKDRNLEDLSLEDIKKNTDCSDRMCIAIKNYLTSPLLTSNTLEYWQQLPDYKTPEGIACAKELTDIIDRYCKKYIQWDVKPVFYRYYGLGDFYNQPMLMKDISKELKISLGTVQNRVYRNVNRLGQAIGDKLDFYV